MDKDKIQRQILEAYPGTIPDMDIDWDMGEIFYKAGIKEVVEWVEKNSFRKPIDSQKPYDGRWLYQQEEEWQAKLKEWGLQENK